MPIEIRIPKLGISMTEAILNQWLVEDGTTVQAGTPLYEIEMDKSTNEIEAPASGTLRIVGEVGDTYEVGSVIATIE